MKDAFVCGILFESFFSLIFIFVGRLRKKREMPSPWFYYLRLIVMTSPCQQSHIPHHSRIVSFHTFLLSPSPRKSFLVCLHILSSGRDCVGVDHTGSGGGGEAGGGGG